MSQKVKTLPITLLICTLALLPLLFVNCSGSFEALNDGLSGGSTSSGGNTSVPSVNANASNVMPVTVGCGYVNEPCVSVTICSPGTNNCQTIPNVLLDTGSYGLRLFSNVSMDGFSTASTSLMALNKVADPANSANVLAECISYADGSSDWGPVAKADVLMGTERASNVSIQVIDSTFGTPSGCTNLDSTPTATGFNGILGVGLFAQDCGSSCTTSASNQVYYSCPASGSGTCLGAMAPLALQTSNPVASLPVDNNGVILEMAAIPLSGAVQATGYLVMGIGTQANNTLTGATFFQADPYGDFVTTFNGSTSASSFIDSGSNGLFFPAPSSVPQCTGSTQGFYCPTSELSYTAVQVGAGGGQAKTVTFNLGNAATEFSNSNPNYAFSDLGGQMSSDFDWGLPFFYGRAIAVGLENTSSSFGTGPYWAY